MKFLLSSSSAPLAALREITFCASFTASTTGYTLVRQRSSYLEALFNLLTQPETTQQLCLLLLNS